jgi:hypothetical protein
MKQSLLLLLLPLLSGGLGPAATAHPATTAHPAAAAKSVRDVKFCDSALQDKYCSAW